MKKKIRLTQRPLFDGFEIDNAVNARDVAIETVLENAGEDWRGAALQLIVTKFRHREATGEDLRLACEADGIVPHHPNAWGAFVMNLCRQGFLEKTGRYQQMKSKKSHARETKVYRVI
jgi:hypothetical protein